MGGFRCVSRVPIVALTPTSDRSRGAQGTEEAFGGCFAITENPAPKTSSVPVPFQASLPARPEIGYKSDLNANR